MNLSVNALRTLALGFCLFGCFAWQAPAGAGDKCGPVCTCATTGLTGICPLHGPRVGRHCNGGVATGTCCSAPPQGCYFGYYSTCWHRWPYQWQNCPVGVWETHCHHTHGPGPIPSIVTPVEEVPLGRANQRPISAIPIQFRIQTQFQVESPAPLELQPETQTQSEIRTQQTAPVFNTVRLAPEMNLGEGMEPAAGSSLR